MSVLERVREVESTRGAAEQAPVSLRLVRERLKGALVERMGLSVIAGMLSSEEAKLVRDELTVALEAILNGRGFEGLLPDERDMLVRQVLDEVCGLGPIQSLLEDDEITEVMINGCSALFYEREGELHPAETVFDSPEQIMIVMDRILAPLGRRLDRSSPIVSARLANGDRVNAVASPVAIDGPAHASWTWGRFPAGSPSCCHGRCAPGARSRLRAGRGRARRRCSTPSRARFP